MSEKHELLNGEPVLFADGETRVIRPLTLRQLRKFMKVIKNLRNDEGNVDVDDEDIDLMVQAAAVALEKVDPDLAVDIERLEDALDLKSFNALLVAAMGNDPNA